MNATTEKPLVSAEEMEKLGIRALELNPEVLTPGSLCLRRGRGPVGRRDVRIWLEECEGCFRGISFHPRIKDSWWDLDKPDAWRQCFVPPAPRHFDRVVYMARFEAKDFPGDPLDGLRDYMARVEGMDYEAMPGDELRVYGCSDEEAVWLKPVWYRRAPLPPLPDWALACPSHRHLPL